MFRKSLIGVLLASCLGLSSCSKSTNSNTGPLAGNDKLDYGDSVFYLPNNTNSDYIINPVQAVTGKFYGFPEGIEIDENTGAINVSKSETGLRYRISFVPTDKSDSISTLIVISGINFLDGFYNLSSKDSIARPIYNGKLANVVPGVTNGSIFDEGSNCNNNGCTVNTLNGQINLAETVRNNVFGITPANNDRKEFQMNYRINDKSGKAFNTIRVKLYYFNSMAEVTQEAYDIIASREGTIFGLTAHNLLTQMNVQTNEANSIARINNATKPAKPRPPCIFIVGH